MFLSWLYKFLSWLYMFLSWLYMFLSWSCVFLCGSRLQYLGLMSWLTRSICRSRSRCQRRSALLWMSTRQRIVASRCSCCSSQISSFLCSWSDASTSSVCVSGKWTHAGAVLVSVVSVFCSSCGVCSGCWVSLNVNSPYLMSSWNQNKILFYKKILI